MRGKYLFLWHTHPLWEEVLFPFAYPHTMRGKRIFHQHTFPLRYKYISFDIPTHYGRKILSLLTYARSERKMLPLTCTHHYERKVHCFLWNTHPLWKKSNISIYIPTERKYIFPVSIPTRYEKKISIPLTYPPTMRGKYYFHQHTHYPSTERKNTYSISIPPTIRPPYNLQGHSSLTSRFVNIHKMNFDVICALYSYTHIR